MILLNYTWLVGVALESGREGGGEQAVARLGGLEAGAGRGRQCGSGGGSAARRRQRG